MKKHLPLLILLLCASPSTPLFADDKGYVTDQLTITLRSGQSTKHQILKMLPSGMEVDVLKTDKDTGYSKIRTDNGMTGWVLSRYLDSFPSGRERLARVKTELKQLKSDHSQLTKSNQELSTANKGFETKVQQLSQEKRRLDQELKRIKRVSSDAISLDSENASLKDQLRRLERDTQLLKHENSVLSDNSSRDWFIVGAAVVLFGMIIGLIIPKIHWRKKNQWRSL